MKRQADHVEVLRRIRIAVERAGSQRAWGRQIGVSSVFISNVLHGKKGPGPKILAAIGLRRSPAMYAEVK